MIKNALFATAAIVGLAFGASAPASAHNALDIKEGYAGYSTPMVLSVNHGCKSSPPIGLRIRVPDGVTDAKAAFDPAWDIEYKMRTLETPIMAHGRSINEVVGEIIWKNPVKAMTASAWYPFKFRMTLPDEPGKVFHVQNITVCEDSTDPYVDLPETALDINDPEFAKKTWAFMTATATPAPFLVIRAPEKKQYPWEWTPEQARGEASQQEAMAK